MKKIPAEFRDHIQRVAELGCIISGMPAVVHHCRGGSMTAIAGLAGGNKRPCHYLVIPLHPTFHTGDQGIHVLGVHTWERRFGKQIYLLDQVSRRLGYNVWVRAGINRLVDYLGESVE